MKNRLVKVLVLISFFGISSMADDVAKDTSYSLLGFEGGYSNLDYEIVTPNKNYSYGVGYAGLKIGAETGHYRIFLSARYYNASDFDYMTTLGVEFQYLFNVSKSFDVYIGANTGLAYISFTPKGENTARTISNAYYGGDIGVNIHAKKNIDLEIGTRVMDIGADNTRNSIDYRFNTLISGYVGVIFKY